MSLYANLKHGDPLLNSDDVSRYCQPGKYDRARCEPKISAFQRRPSEPDVSINRLQFFQLSDRDSTIDCIRQEFLANNYGLEEKGRFVVFNVGAAKTAVLESGYELDFTCTPISIARSHSSIFRFPKESDGARIVATAIKRLITRVDTYPAYP